MKLKKTGGCFLVIFARNKSIEAKMIRENVRAANSSAVKVVRHAGATLIMSAKNTETGLMAWPRIEVFCLKAERPSRAPSASLWTKEFWQFIIKTGTEKIMLFQI
ncbi:MAG TPA: hypothetical protein VNG32_03970 [Candidatus Dormibacteraeota bacterium]|nr:hypothetical protein [Candidatus Dormibacteraeota bacterium]